nr:MAG TPA: hypothetical protein [Caudoviricetes sp.]
MQCCRNLTIASDNFIEPPKKGLTTTIMSCNIILGHDKKVVLLRE